MYEQRTSLVDVVIGIDPGKKTGVAWMGLKPMRIDHVDTSTFWDVYEQLMTLKEWHPGVTQQVVVVIENGGAISPVVHNARNARAQNKTAKRVGGNNRESDLLAEGIERLGFKVFRPMPRHTKKSADYVKRLTNFEGRTNNHNRDAITMIWGGQWHLM